MRRRSRRIRGFGRAALQVGSARAAFSLVELVLVTVIIGILTAMVVPRYGNSLAHRRVEAAAHRIAADLALAQRRARMTSTNQTVIFDTDTNSYRIEGAQHLDHPQEEYAVSLSDDTYGAVLVTIDLGGATPKEIVFSGHGLPDGGGEIVVEAGGNQRTIAVDADTGLARVE